MTEVERALARVAGHLQDARRIALLKLALAHGHQCVTRIAPFTYI
jgi:hypothetical protein